MKWLKKVANVRAFNFAKQDCEHLEFRKLFKTPFSKAYLDACFLVWKKCVNYFMMVAVTIQKPVHWLDWFLYDTGLRHERVNFSSTKRLVKYAMNGLRPQTFLSYNEFMRSWNEVSICISCSFWKSQHSFSFSKTCYVFHFFNKVSRSSSFHSSL